MTRMTKTRMASTLFRDFREQISWGRVGAAVALTVAIALSFQPTPSVPLVSAWLACAFGNYGASKLTEIFSRLSQGAGSPGTGSVEIPSANPGEATEGKP